MNKDKPVFVPFKYVFYLKVDGRNAVVVESNFEAARQRAALYEIDGGWENAGYAIISEVRNSFTSRVLALEKKT